MIRKAFKIGDVVTIKRTAPAGTGYQYALVCLNGGVALVDETKEPADEPGGMTVQSFTFQFLQPGMVEIRFAYYRDVKEIIDKDIFTYIVTEPEKNDVICGGWGDFDAFTEQEREIFQACMRLKGVEYIPLIVARQLVSGHNYCYFCLTRSITLEPKFGFAKVYIYAPLKGDPVLTSIVEY